MKKLEKRQIIILAIAALFVLYAIYDLLIAGPAAKKASKQAMRHCPLFPLVALFLHYLSSSSTWQV